MKRTVSLALVFILAVSMLTTLGVSAQTAFVYGDADGDGEVTAVDATVVIRHTVHLLTLTGDRLRAATVSGDDELTIVDAAWIQRKVVRMIDRFPVEDTEPEDNDMKMTINGTPVSVEWEDNEAVKALREAVKDAPLTVNTSAYGGFEQVGSLGMSLPRSDTRITTSPGDIILYSGDQMVVFYGSNTWAYTRLGRITDKTDKELAAMLSGSGAEIVISL